MSYELYNHTTVRLFKGDELMCNEYCDGIHCESLMSLITLRRSELKILLRIVEESCVLYIS